MDVDPLADSVPPRHAIESDDEDEFNPLSSSSQSNLERRVEVEITGDIEQRNNLVITTGNAGKFWAEGASLGEQKGAVMVNDIQVGLVFRPSWTRATVLVSEVTTMLPTWSMHTFADAVTRGLLPKSVALLDTYPAPSYISGSHVHYSDAPVRYLSSTPFSMEDNIFPFSPPNLLQSTSASFLSQLSTPNNSSTKYVLLLLPSPHIPSAPPQKLIPANVTITQNPIEWPAEMMRSIHRMLFSCIGEGVQHWQHRETDTIGKFFPKMKREQIGDGGMYI